MCVYMYVCMYACMYVCISACACEYAYLFYYGGTLIHPDDDDE